MNETRHRRLKGARGMKLLSGIFLVGFCLYTIGIFAQDLYRWVDESGGIHFTDNFHSVPEKYRDQVEKRTLPSPPSKSPIEPQPGQFQPTTKPQRFIVPFTRNGNHIIVNGTVNGKGPVKFILDTGAGGTMIPRAMASQLGISAAGGILITARGIGGTVTVPLIEIDSLNVGGAKVKDLEVTLQDFPFGKIGPVGLLGADFLLEYRVDIQYAKNQLSLEARQRPYAGHSNQWWQKRFRRYYRIKKDYEDNRSKAGSEKQRAWIDKQLHALEKKINELEIRASRAGVPQAFRR